MPFALATLVTSAPSTLISLLFDHVRPAESPLLALESVAPQTKTSNRSAVVFSIGCLVSGRARSCSKVLFAGFDRESIDRTSRCHGEGRELNGRRTQTEKPTPTEVVVLGGQLPSPVLCTAINKLYVAIVTRLMAVANGYKNVHGIGDVRPDSRRESTKTHRLTCQMPNIQPAHHTKPQRKELLPTDASLRGWPRTDRYMSVSSTLSSHSRNRDNVIRGFVRVSITPIRSWARKSTNNHRL